MKKVVTIMVCICMAVLLVACNAPAPTTTTSAAVSTVPSVAPTAAGGGVDIGYCVPNTTNPFVGWLTGAVKDLATAEGLRVEIADANGDSTTQLAQIENFITMRVKALALMPVDPMAVADSIRKAQAAGVKVLVAGTDTGVYDVMMNTNQYNLGEQISEMAIDWLAITFPTVEKPKVIVIKYTQTIDGNNRSQGIIDKINASGKATVVVAQAESITSAQGTTVISDTWLQNSDAVCVLTYNADTATGVNEYLMGLQGDKSKLAVFSGDFSPPVQEMIDKSLTNLSVFRGTMQIVGPTINGEKVDLPLATFNALKGLCEGKLVYGNKITDAVAKYLPTAAAPAASK